VGQKKKLNFVDQCHLSLEWGTEGS
jgi:hypothetical protein